MDHSNASSQTSEALTVWEIQDLREKANAKEEKSTSVEVSRDDGGLRMDTAEHTPNSYTRGMDRYWKEQFRRESAARQAIDDNDARTDMDVNPVRDGASKEGDTSSCATATLPSKPGAFSRPGVEASRHDDDISDPGTSPHHTPNINQPPHQSLIRAERVNDAVPIVEAKDVQRDNYRRRVIAVVLTAVLGCIILALVLGLGINNEMACQFDDEVCCGVDFASLAIPQNIPLLCHCNQSLDHVVAGLTGEGLNASEMMLDAAIDHGLVESNVTINLTSCAPLDQLYLSTAYMEDWTGISIDNLLTAAPREFVNFYALAYFYIEAVGVSWSQNEFWYQEFQVCQWFGAQCLFLDTLSALNLPSNKLQGRIPTVLGSLPTLRILNLAGNFLYGSIPSELTGITALNTLDLSNSQLNGTIPSELGGLTRLNLLSLANNSLTGAIPLELFEMTQLETLGLSSNNLSGSISSRVGNATELVVLELGKNMLTGSLPSEISNLSRLELLNVRANDLRGSIPSSVWQLTTLELINFVDSGLDVETIPDAACNVSSQRVILMRCTDEMVGRNETLPECFRCIQDLTTSINGT